MQTQMRKDNGIELIPFQRADSPRYIEQENCSRKPRTHTTQLSNKKYRLFRYYESREATHCHVLRAAEIRCFCLD